MKPDEILPEVHRQVIAGNFFQASWSEFCSRMEDYGQTVNTLWKKAAETFRQQARDATPVEVHGRMVFDLDKEAVPHGPNDHWVVSLWSADVWAFIEQPLVAVNANFWMPPDVQNPAVWFHLARDWRSIAMSSQDQLLHDAVVLAVTHDGEMQPGEPRIYQPSTYKGEYFRCDDFYRTLKERLAGETEQIERAWERAKPHIIEADPEQNGETVQVNLADFNKGGSRELLAELLSGGGRERGKQAVR